MKKSDPLNRGSGVYEKDPSVFNVKDPFETSVSKLAVRRSPSTSLSFTSTPGAATFSAASSTPS